MVFMIAGQYADKITETHQVFKQPIEANDRSSTQEVHAHMTNLPTVSHPTTNASRSNFTDTSAQTMPEHSDSQAGRFNATCESEMMTASMRLPAPPVHMSTVILESSDAATPPDQSPQARAAQKLDAWVNSCPNDSEQRNWQAVAQQMKAEGVTLDGAGRYIIEGDLFANDFTGLIAPHAPLSLPDNLTVTGTLDLNFFSGLQTLPKGLIVGESLILTGIQDVLTRTPHPVVEKGRVINGEHAAQ